MKLGQIIVAKNWISHKQLDQALQQKNQRNYYNEKLYDKNATTTSS
jgi:hypothetical protein